jgi:hypothetical protein
MRFTLDVMTRDDRCAACGTAVLSGAVVAMEQLPGSLFREVWHLECAALDLVKRADTPVDVTLRPAAAMEEPR